MLDSSHTILPKKGSDVLRKQLSLEEFIDLYGSIKTSCDEFSFENNYAIYRSKVQPDNYIKIEIPRIFWSESNAYPSEVISHYEQKKYYSIMVIRAGEAIIAACYNNEIIEYKLIKKYMVRKTQGKAQYKFLKQKGKSRLGSRIRLQQTEKFFTEINTVIEKFENNYKIERIFLSCTPNLLGTWRTAGSSLIREDHRIEKLGLSLSEVSHWQLKNLVKRLTTAYQEEKSGN